MRSVVHLTSPSGISALVKQQFEIARHILDVGLLLIIEPEVNIKSAEREQCDRKVRHEIETQLNASPESYKVALKLSLPARRNLFSQFACPPRVARIASGMRATVAAGWLVSRGFDKLDVYLGSKGTWKAAH